ncbi:MAG: sodium:solute symporter family protein [Planctomycetota bacterium]
MTTAVFLVVLVATLLLGAVAGRRVRDLKGYYVAGANAGPLLLIGTFLASNVSAALFLGATNMAAQVGYAFWCAYVPTAVGFLLCLGWIGPAVRRLARAREIFTFPEILGARFASRSGSLRLLTALLIPALYLPYVAAQLDGVAAVVSRIFGLEGAAAAMGLPGGRELALCGVIGVLLLYTMWGGMKAVVWTDLLQMSVLGLGIFLLVPLALSYLGEGDLAAGTERALDAAPAGAFTLTSEGWPWAMVAGQMVWLFAIPAQPHLMTRILAARDEKVIRTALPWCLLGLFLIYLSTIPVGLLGRALVPDLQPGHHYYVEVALVGLGALPAGIALAGVAAAALSTGDTEVALAGQALSRDLYQRHLRPDAPQRHVFRVARCGVLVTAALTFAIAWWRPAGIYWMGRASAALFASAFFVPLAGGLLWRRATGTGAVAGVVAGLAGTLAVLAARRWGLLADVPEFVVGLACAAVGLVLGSLATPTHPDEEEAAAIMTGRS